MSDDYPTDNDWEQVVRGLRGTTSGLEHERDAFLSILTDLIAAVREQSNYVASEHGFFWRMDRVQDAADRAEARLREITEHESN